VNIELERTPAESGSPPGGVGLLFDIRRYSVHDGPGIRTAVFLKGCPLSCWWCHNPEGRSPKPNLILFKDRCLGCGDCLAVCPQGAIVRDDGAIRTLPSVCRACGTCVETCPSDARQLAGRWMTVAAVVREIEKDVAFYDESGGGVTLSGGEPLAQPHFVDALLEACVGRRIHTVVDTCGLVVRFPVIPSINDGAEDIRQMAAFLSRLGLLRIDLLPYHRIGVEKYRRLGMQYRLEGLAPPSADHVRQIGQQLEREGFAVRVGA
jgi:pyruvate formate lyase activating enzyme